MKKETIIVILFLLAIIILSLIPYYSIKDNVYLDNDTFSSLGSYISGMVSILNLIVFVYLTNTVATYEKNKSLNEIKTQKLITQTHFRQSELEKLVIELDKAFENHNLEFTTTVILKYTNSLAYLNNFLEQKKYLFPILKDEICKNKSDELKSNFEMIIKSLSKYDSDSNANELNKKSIFSKNSFINHLQKYIVDQLEQ